MNNQKRPAIFIDRDGTLIEEVHYLSKLEDIQIYPNVVKGLKALKEAGYYLIVITNQSGVARGYFTEEFVRKSFTHLNQLLAKEEVELDAQYYCPHHLKGKAPYNLDCNCRKPNPGMIESAIRDFPIDLENSVMIGDKLCDVELGIKAGTGKSILVRTGHGLEEEKNVTELYPALSVQNTFYQACLEILAT